MVMLEACRCARRAGAIAVCYGGRHARQRCETAASSGRLIGMEIVELNPTLDLENKTGRLSVWLIESALGRTIL